jgi:ADP-ribose pyrophosphatase YjhB (NUDIX family)
VIFDTGSSSLDNEATSRRYPPRPILGVGALIIRDDQVLLVQRGKEPLKGYWSLPGGAVEAGEALETAIRREVLEETNLDVEVMKVIEIFERITRDAEGRAEYHYVLIDYLCTVKGGEARAGSDAAGIAWLRRGELENFSLTEGAAQVIRKAFDAAARIEA